MVRIIVFARFVINYAEFQWENGNKKFEKENTN